MDQPACLEENLLTNLIKLSIKMTSRGFRPYCSPCRNLFPIDHIEDKFAKHPGPANGSYLGSTSFATSCNHTLGLALVPALIPTPVLALAPILLLFNELFKQFMKAYLELNQGPRQPPAECKQLLKAKAPNVYYRKLHINCYHFCQ